MIPLYDEAMEDCVLLVEKHTPDGSGGTVTAWTVSYTHLTLPTNSRV